MKGEEPIGLFDSGVGGLTVVQAIKRRLPGENLIYLGDTARLPYGGKSRETILRYSMENAAFLIQKGIKLLVVACNTASAYALPHLEQVFKIPIIGVIEAGVESAVSASKGKNIAVIGTQGTISSGVYQEQIRRSCPDANIIAIPCPLLVPLVEEKFVGHPATRLVLQEYLRPLKGTSTDTLLLGCTHYPILKQMIQAEVGGHVHIVDSASTCTEMVFQRLSMMGKLRTACSSPFHHYFVSDDPRKFGVLAKDFLGEPIVAVQKNEEWQTGVAH